MTDNQESAIFFVVQTQTGGYEEVVLGQTSLTDEAMYGEVLPAPGGPPKQQYIDDLFCLRADECRPIYGVAPNHPTHNYYEKLRSADSSSRLLEGISEYKKKKSACADLKAGETLQVEKKGNLIDVTRFIPEEHGLPAMYQAMCTISVTPRSNIFEASDAAYELPRTGGITIQVLGVLIACVIFIVMLQLEKRERRLMQMREHSQERNMSRFE